MYQSHGGHIGMRSLSGEIITSGEYRQSCNFNKAHNGKRDMIKKITPSCPPPILSHPVVILTGAHYISVHQ